MLFSSTDFYENLDIGYTEDMKTLGTLYTNSQVKNEEMIKEFIEQMKTKLQDNHYEMLSLNFSDGFLIIKMERILMILEIVN